MAKTINYIDASIHDVNPQYKLNINVYGSKIRKQSDPEGGLPFSGKELSQLLTKALAKSKLSNAKIGHINVSEKSPTLYGSDPSDPEILKGRIKESIESVEFVLEL